MPDTLMSLGRSMIQHGPGSDRVYVLRLDPKDMPGILDEVDGLAREEGYGKIVAKGRRRDIQAFQDRGYQAEAVVPLMFGPAQDGVFMGKFLDETRCEDPQASRVEAVLEKAREEGVPKEDMSLSTTSRVPRTLSVREGTASDVEALARCYDAVFESYPFPIHDPGHLRREMEEGTIFFTVWEDDTLVAASSMEDGGAPGAVEMTDFATLPSHRGKGLATHLLGLMDRTAARGKARVAYTIARAVSFGMNITFARRGYTYGGTLIANTQIGGTIESMNVWYKVLEAEM